MTGFSVKSKCAFFTKSSFYQLTKARKSTFRIDKVHTIKPVYCGSVTTKLLLEQKSISMTNWFLKILVSEEPELAEIKNNFPI